MIALGRIVLAVEAMTLVVGLSHLGLPGAVIARLKRFVTAGGLDNLFFSESVPVPHSRVVGQFGQQFTRSRALKAFGILYRPMWYGLIAKTGLFMLARVVRWP